MVSRNQLNQKKLIERRMTSDRISVYTTNQMYEAEIVRQILSDHGINSFLLDKMDSAYKFGDIEIHVKGDDVMRAKLLIQEFEEQ